MNGHRSAQGYRLLNRDGQHLAEYAIIIGVAATAVVGMQTYVRRVIQARVKAQIDQLLVVAPAGSLPSKCTDATPPITDPAECTQFLGTVIQDVTELEARAGGPTELSRATRETHQQTATAYSNPGDGTTATFTLRNDGTLFRVTGTADSLTKNNLPPEFVRRPQLPNGLPTGAMVNVRSRTPSVPEVSGAASAQRVGEAVRRHNRHKHANSDKDDEGNEAE